jgi:hypothetical protein
MRVSQKQTGNTWGRTTGWSCHTTWGRATTWG